MAFPISIMTKETVGIKQRLANGVMIGLSTALLAGYIASGFAILPSSGTSQSARLAYNESTPYDRVPGTYKNYIWNSDNPPTSDPIPQDASLSVAGNVKANGAFYRNGIPGMNAACSSGMVLKNAIVSGGIVTSGTCMPDEIGAGTTLWEGIAGQNINPVLPTSTKVGIGTATPAQRLSIAGGYLTTGLSGPANQLHFGASGSSPSAAQIVWGDASGWKLHFGTRGGASFIPRMTLVDTGNVGIGADSPDARLKVVGATATDQLALGRGISGYLRLGTDQNDNPYIATNASNQGTSWNYVNTLAFGGTASGLTMTSGFAFLTASGGTNPINWNTRMVIQNNGNVGIGGTNPSGKLVVNNNHSGAGSSGDAIAAFANTTTGSALYAEQDGAGQNAWAGYFSGKVKISNGDFSADQNVWGQDAQGSAGVAGMVSCSFTENNAQTGCKCPDGAYIASISMVNGSNNSMQIYCKKL